MSDRIQSILKAQGPLTLAGVPAGFLPWLAGDLARAAHGSTKGGRAVIITADESAMRALADTAPLFAPELEVLTLPAWECLPYDRASPALRVMAERLSTLNALQQKRTGPQLLVTTAAAATQRLLTPFRIRQLTQRVAAGERIERLLHCRRPGLLTRLIARQCLSLRMRRCECGLSRIVPQPHGDR